MMHDNLLGKQCHCLCNKEVSSQSNSDYLFHDDDSGLLLIAFAVTSHPVCLTAHVQMLALRDELAQKKETEKQFQHVLFLSLLSSWMLIVALFTCMHQ